MRKYYLDNIRWITVVIVVEEHDFPCMSIGKMKFVRKDGFFRICVIFKLKALRSV